MRHRISASPYRGTDDSTVNAWEKDKTCAFHRHSLINSTVTHEVAALQRLIFMALFYDKHLCNMLHIRTCFRLFAAMVLWVKQHFPLFTLTLVHSYTRSQWQSRQNSFVLKETATFRRCWFFSSVWPRLTSKNIESCTMSRIKFTYLPVVMLAKQYCQKKCFVSPSGYNMRHLVALFSECNKIVIYITASSYHVCTKLQS